MKKEMICVKEVVEERMGKAGVQSKDQLHLV